MIDVISDIRDFLNNKSILILGFGREGKSTYNFIKRYVNYKKLGISDKEEPECEEEKYFGKNYLDAVKDYDIVIKSPGIPFFNIPEDVQVTSQTELMLMANRKNIIGITGTKGKSTTSSLIYCILKDAGKNVKLVGNIGIPIFESLEVVTLEVKTEEMNGVGNAPNACLYI